MAAIAAIVTFSIAEDLILNMDATTFTVGHDLKGTVTVEYPVKEEGKPLKAMPDTKQKGACSHWFIYN